MHLSKALKFKANGAQKGGDRKRSKVAPLGEHEPSLPNATIPDSSGVESFLNGRKEFNKSVGDEEVDTSPPNIWCHLTPYWLLARLVGWEEAILKAQGELASLGVLSALICTFAFPLYIEPPDFEKWSDEEGLSGSGAVMSKVMVLYDITSAMATLCAVASVGISFLTWVQLNLIVSQEVAYKFFVKFAYIFILNILLFLGSLAFMGFVTLSVGLARFSLALLLSLASIAAIFFIGLGITAFHLYYLFAFGFLKQEQKSVATVIRRMQSAVAQHHNNRAATEYEESAFGNIDTSDGSRMWTRVRSVALHADGKVCKEPQTDHQLGSSGTRVFNEDDAPLIMTDAV